MNIEKMIALAIGAVTTSGTLACSPASAGLDSTQLESSWSSSTIAAPSSTIAGSPDSIDETDVSPEQVERHSISWSHVGSRVDVSHRHVTLPDLPSQEAESTSS